MITGTTKLDLRRDSRDADRRAVTLVPVVIACALVATRRDP